MNAAILLGNKIPASSNPSMFYMRNGGSPHMSRSRNATFLPFCCLISSLFLTSALFAAALSR